MSASPVGHDRELEPFWVVQQGFVRPGSWPFKGGQQHANSLIAFRWRALRRVGLWMGEAMQGGKHSREKDEKRKTYIGKMHSKSLDGSLEGGIEPQQA
ncbi:MAG: hypothetical protein RID07_06220, partial [Lacipirellulaceae bacterium]